VKGVQVGRILRLFPRRGTHLNAMSLRRSGGTTSSPSPKEKTQILEAHLGKVKETCSEIKKERG